jgi:hypothetical protein
MPSSLAIVGFALGASAALIPRQNCCFSLTASGGASGPVGQLSDGQNRIGLGGGASASYCLSNGAITDSSGRGCILTSPTTQFQCDTGATPQSGFSVSSGGELEYAGNTEFYACPASSNQYNIYTTPVSGQQKCTKVTLSTGGKCSGSSAGVGSSSSSASPSQSATSQSIYHHSSPNTWVSMTSQVSSQMTVPSQQTWTSAETCAPVTVTVTSTLPCEQCTTGEATGTIPVAPSNSASGPSGPASQWSSNSEISTDVTETVHPSTDVTTSAPIRTTPAQQSTWVQSSAQPSTWTQSSPAQSSQSTSQVSTVPANSATPATGTAPASGTPSACQTSLTGAYQTPHLIVPISSTDSNQAYGTSYNGQVNATTSTIFNFDIPQSYSDRTCSIIFLFPKQSQLETSSYTFSGSGSIKFSELSNAASQQTTWSNCPIVSKDLNTIAIQSGNSYVVSTGSCKAGMTESIMMSSEGGLSLDFFEDWNPSSLGLYITSC